MSKFFFKSVNIWQSYKQKRDCLVHFFRLLVVCWPGAQSVRKPVIKDTLQGSVATYLRCGGIVNNQICQLKNFLNR